MIRVVALVVSLALACGCSAERSELESGDGKAAGAANPHETRSRTSGSAHEPGDTTSQRVVSQDPPRMDHDSTAEPSLNSTTIRLRWTMPDSVEWRRWCGNSRPDSAARAASWVRGEVWFVPRFGPPYWPPPPGSRDTMLCATSFRQPGSPVDTTIATPGHGSLYVRAANQAGSSCPSRLTHARTVE